MTDYNRGAYALGNLSTDELSAAYSYTNRMRGRYNGERGDLLPLGTRVQVRRDVMTARTGCCGVITAVDGKTHPYAVTFDDGVTKSGYMGWELETVEDDSERV